MRRLVPLLALLTVACGTFQPGNHREIDRAIETAISEHRIPGGVLWIERDGRVYQRAYGRRSLVPSVEPMTTDTLFDVASITKPVATASSIAVLVERGQMALDDPLKKHLPEYADEAVTLRHLLTHTSGLRPGIATGDGYAENIARAARERPLNRPGAVFRYSDVNYILLGEVVRRVSGETLDVFAAKNVFQPLGMSRTQFRPAEAGRRAAPTEHGLRGVVHDPTSRAMGGVAGHAGLFSTAEDLAKFARFAMTHPLLGADSSPPEVAIRRTGGFDIDSAYSRPGGDRFPYGSFGHTGWTGGFLWIDPQSRSFYIFLSNRVHPDGKGSVIALQKQLGNLVGESFGFAPRTRRVGLVVGGGDAQNGIDVLHASGYEQLRGLRVGLITNQSGIDRTGNPTVDLLRSAPGVTLAAIFTPEHGLRGTLDDKVADEEYRGIPVYSLYGERRKPSAEQLAGLDALVFDVQDIGTRFYTYISTMGLAMEAAAEARVTFVVLDRVNPIGGDVIEGPVLEGERNFTGWHPLPVRHGKTVGELAHLFREERGIAVDLVVIPVKGWKREQWQDEAGLPWVNTSPNMRSLQAAALYPGIGLMERALSVGRGTPTPFEVLGAPYVDGDALVREVGPLPGLELTPVRFTPTASVHQGEECGGVRLTITDRRALRSVQAGLTIAAALVRLYGEKFPVDELQPLLRHPETLRRVRNGENPEP